MVPSLPPEAQREPSGEMVTVLMYPVWPMWSVWSLQVESSQTYERVSTNLLNLLKCPRKKEILRSISQGNW